MDTHTGAPSTRVVDLLSLPGDLPPCSGSSAPWPRPLGYLSWVVMHHHRIVHQEGQPVDKTALDSWVEDADLQINKQ